MPPICVDFDPYELGPYDPELRHQPDPSRPAVVFRALPRDLEPLRAKQGEVGALQVLSCLEHAQFLRQQRGFSFPPNAGGVHKLEPHAVPLYLRLDGVPGGSGQRGHDRTLFVHQTIQQGGFADVRQTHDTAFESHRTLPSP